MLNRRTVLIVLLLLLTLPALAQDTLFDATFDDDTLPDGLNIQYGTYEITDGILSYTVDNGGFLVIPEGVGWTDYAIEARLRITAGSVWLQARTGNDLCSGYYLTINQTDDVYDLSIANRECDFTIVDIQDTAGIPSDWLVTRIEVTGDQIRTTIDGNDLFTTTDDQYGSGYPTINVFSADGEAAQIEFDYIQVVDLIAAEVEAPTPTIEPTETPVSEATPEPEPTEAAIATEETATETPASKVTAEPESTEAESVDLPTVSEITLSDDLAETIEMLKEVGLIPASEGQLHQANTTIISRVGAWFEPLFEDESANNLVMSGDIRFLPYSETEACLLSVRILRDEVGVAQRYLDVGINSSNEVLIGETAENGDYSQAVQGDILTQPDGNLLFVAHNNRLSVFINGQVVFQNVEVTERDGNIGISSIATTSFSICHISNIWAYTFDD